MCIRPRGAQQSRDGEVRGIDAEVPGCELAVRLAAGAAGQQEGELKNGCPGAEGSIEIPGQLWANSDAESGHFSANERNRTQRKEAS